MVSAVLLQIMTEGPIEKILYGNPQMTFFRSVYIRPTNFASKYSVKSPPGKVDWGQTIDIKVPREADWSFLVNYSNCCLPGLINIIQS